MAYHQRWRWNVRLEVLAHYGGHPLRCTCPGCPVTDAEFLVLDHVDNNGAEHRRLTTKSKGRGGFGTYLWLRLHNYPAKWKLRVVCHNCNAARQAYGHCPHEGPVNHGGPTESE